MAVRRHHSHFLCLLLLFADAVHADQLPVVNPSFENLSRALAVGEQTNGAAGAGQPVATRFPFAGGGVSWADPVEVPGWRTFFIPPPDIAVSHAGVLNPPLRGNGEPFLTGQDGTNVSVLQAAKLGQTLDVRLQPNTRYRLEFLGGIGLFDSPYSLHAGLIAVDDMERLPLEGQPGVQRLVLTSFIVPAETFGTMQPYALEYRTPETLPPHLVDRYIGIHLYGSDGIPRVAFDNFRLDAATVPEPSACGLMMLLGLCGKKSRGASRRR